MGSRNVPQDLTTGIIELAFQKHRFQQSDNTTSECRIGTTNMIDMQPATLQRITLRSQSTPSPKKKKLTSFPENPENEVGSRRRNPQMWL